MWQQRASVLLNKWHMWWALHANPALWQNLVIGTHMYSTLLFWFFTFAFLFDAFFSIRNWLFSITIFNTFLAVLIIVYRRFITIHCWFQIQSVVVHYVLWLLQHSPVFPRPFDMKIFCTMEGRRYPVVDNNLQGVVRTLLLFSAFYIRSPSDNFKECYS